MTRCSDRKGGYRVTCVITCRTAFGRRVYGRSGHSVCANKGRRREWRLARSHGPRDARRKRAFVRTTRTNGADETAATVVKSRMGRCDKGAAASDTNLRTVIAPVVVVVPRLLSGSKPFLRRLRHNYRTTNDFRRDGRS